MPNSQKGFIPILIVLALVALGAVGVATEKDAITTAVKQNLISQPTISPTPTALPFNVQETENLIHVSGSQQLLGQTVSYDISVPKNGGEIQGSVQGVCSGTTKGTLENGTSGNFKGTATGSCQIAFIKKDFSVDYSGKIHEDTKTIDVTWNGQVPLLMSSGSFSLNY
jgi:hypothetical protein